MRLPRPDADSWTSLAIATASSFSRSRSQACVSPPVSGREPILTVGMRTRSWSNATISSRASSTEARRADSSGMHYACQDMSNVQIYVIYDGDPDGPVDRLAHAVADGAAS